MKNLTKIFLAVAVAMLAFSCVTDTTEDLGIAHEGKAVVVASLEQARTQLGEKADGHYPLYWSEGDAIAVNGIASTTLQGVSANTTNATFSFNSELNYPLCAVYPAPAEGVVAEAEGAQVVTFAAVQPYTVGTFAPGVAPMYGYAEAEGQAVQFNHLSGVLCLNISGNGEVLTGATINAESGAIAGNFDVDCTTGVLTAHADASNSVSVTFGEGLTLGAEATPIYVAVPAGKYGVVSIVLTTADAKTMTVKFDSSNRPIAVGVVREFTAIDFEANVADGEWFEIHNSADMLILAKDAATLAYKGAKLMADVDMSEVDWTPIEGFTKIFDGNRDAGYEITGLKAPLFGTTSATIKNLNINVNIDTASSSYYDSATQVLTLGGIARIAEGPISDCTVSGKVAWAKRAANSCTYVFVGGAVGQAKEGASFTNVKNAANISTTKANNTTFLGGIVAMAGINAGTFSVAVTNCENTGSVTVEEKNYSVDTNRNSYIGGVVGSTFVDLTITGCKNSGAVTHNDAYTKNAFVGGIFGVHFTVKNISINNCENTGAVYVNTACRENAYIGGIFGELKTPQTADMSNLRNSGNVTIEGTSINREIYAGGICGELVNNTDDTTITASNWYNSGVVNMNAGGNYIYSYDGKTKGAYTLYLGGIFGNATRISLDNVDNAGDIIYGKDATFSSDSNGNPNIYIGGIGGQRVTGFVYDCDNSGTLYLRASNPRYHHHIGNLFGQLNAYGAEVKNCTNSGNIEAESTFAPLRCRLAGLFGVLYYSYVNDCTNSGNINYNGATTATNQMYIGGCIGYGYSSSTGNFKVAGLKNKGKITINSGTASKTAQICIAGIAGSLQKLYTDASYVKDCVNIGDIEINLPTTYTGVDVGGIIAHHGSITNTNIVFSGHKQYSTIKAIGWTLNDIGTIKGTNNVTALVATNCSAGGNLVLSTEDGVDSDGNPETVDVITPITTENWFNYIYAGGVYPITDDNTYGGCSLLETKPVVNVVTTPQPAAK